MSGTRLVVGLLALMVLGYLAYLVAMGVVSRRPRVRGLREGRLRACSRFPNCVCSQPGCGKRRVEPIAFSGSPDAAMDRLAAAIAALPRGRVMKREGSYLHAEVSSRLFGFVDDLEAQVDPAAGVLHLRSGSRVGVNDYGVNRRRVERLRARFGAGDDA